MPLPQYLLIISVLALTLAAAPVDNNPFPPILKNSTIPCNFSSAGDVVEYATRYKINGTAIVTSCADVCDVVFGSGNPVG
jgi:hypothetical protein